MYHPQRKRLKQHIGESDLVQRQFKKECDVNTIMAKYQKTGLIDHVNRFQGNYGDFTDTPTFHEAFQKVLDAQAMFLTLPSSVREKFANDPGLFLEYVSDEKNADGMRELGLLPKVAPPKPVEKAEEKPGSKPEQKAAEKPAEKPQADA